MLVVMSGLPGAGKSAVADALGRQLPAPVLSVDPIASAMLTAGIATDQPTGLAAYVVAETLARRMLTLGHTVIVDAVNAVAPAQQQWRAVATELATPVRIIEVVCGDPALHRTRLASRVRDLPNHPEPTWAEVQAVRAGWHPWPEAHLTLDSVHDLTANVARAITYLHSASTD